MISCGWFLSHRVVIFEVHPTVFYVTILFPFIAEYFNVQIYQFFFFKHSHQLKDCMKVLISPHPQHCYYLSFFKIIILVGVKWYLSVVLICISLTVNDAEHLFMCLLAICLSLEKNNFRPFAHFFKNWATFSLLRFFLKKYIFKIYIPYQMYNLQIFSFCGLAFTSLMVPFAA